jgi:Spy/CpxP family protein refolding chaperone
MAQLRSADNPLREQMRQARNEAIRLLVAEPFDEAAYDGQLVKVNELRGQMSKRMSDDMKDLVKGLPPEQRTAVGELLKRPPPPPA